MGERKRESESVIFNWERKKQKEERIIDGDVAVASSITNAASYQGILSALREMNSSLPISFPFLPSYLMLYQYKIPLGVTLDEKDSLFLMADIVTEAIQDRT